MPNSTGERMPEPENTAAGSVPASDNSPRLLEVSMPDESTSQVRIFEPRDHGYEGPLGTAESEIRRPLVVIWPGFGMGARYFDPMGRELASRGYHVASGELRGQGTSTARATRKHTWGYHHLASQDYPLTIRAVKQDLGLDADYPHHLAVPFSWWPDCPALFHAQRSQSAQRPRNVRRRRRQPPIIRGIPELYDENCELA